jgi:hypothetical protein
MLQHMHRRYLKVRRGRLHKQPACPPACHLICKRAHHSLPFDAPLSPGLPEHDEAKVLARLAEQSGKSLDEVVHFSREWSRGVPAACDYQQMCVLLLAGHQC